MMINLTNGEPRCKSLVVRHKKHDPRAAKSTMETLREHFKPHLGLPKARLTCFLMLVLAIIGQRTVSLVWLAQHPHTAARPGRFAMASARPWRVIQREGGEQQHQK